MKKSQANGSSKYAVTRTASGVLNTKKKTKPAHMRLMPTLTQTSNKESRSLRSTMQMVQTNKPAEAVPDKRLPATRNQDGAKPLPCR